MAKDKHIFKINVTYLNIATTVIMAIAIMGIMAIGSANYLRKIEALSIFLPTQGFYLDCMRFPGGWLIWLSTFLTQTLHYPWLGASVYTVLLLGSAALTVKAFGLPRYFYPAVMVVPCFVLLALLNLGYVIFSLKTPGYAFLLPLGVLSGVLAFWGYRSLRAWWLRLVALISIVVGGYIVAGAYALATAAVCIVYEVASTRRPFWPNLLIVIVGITAMWLMPEFWVRHVDTDVIVSMIYRCPLPRFIDGEGSLFTPYYVVLISYALMAIVAGINLRRSASAPKAIATSAIGVAALACMFFTRYDDPNFTLTLDLDRALWQQDWQGAVDRMAGFDQEPTRLNVILSDIALIRSGQAPELMFALPIGAAQYTTVRSMRVPHDAGSMMFSYQLGLINYAYRWAMEYKVEYGLNVEQLKFMTKTALLNGNYQVARKCLDNLKLTAFNRDWADKYMAYVDKPSLIDTDPEMMAIKPLIDEQDTFIDDKGQLEGYIWGKLATAETGGKELLELSLLGALISRKIDDFAARMPFYARLNEHLPRHFQEGILIWSRVHENTGFRQYNIDQTVKDDFVRFIKMQKQYDNLPYEQQRELMRPTFEHTYWFYAIYDRDQQVI